MQFHYNVCIYRHNMALRVLANVESYYDACCIADMFAMTQNADIASFVVTDADDEERKVMYNSDSTIRVTN